MFFCRHHLNWRTHGGSGVAGLAEWKNMRNILFVVFIIFVGCVSQEEKQRQHKIIITVQRELSDVQCDTTLRADVKKHNIEFYETWLDNLKKRGYK